MLVEKNNQLDNWLQGRFQKLFTIHYNLKHETMRWWLECWRSSGGKKGLKNIEIIQAGIENEYFIENRSLKAVKYTERNIFKMNW